MACMSKDVMILKSDAGGRMLVPVERQVNLVREFERNGLSGPRFAAMAGLKYQTFATWRRKHGTLQPTRRRAGPFPPGAEAWMEAVVESGSGAALTVMLPGGATMALSHPGQAALAEKDKSRKIRERYEKDKRYQIVALSPCHEKDKRYQIVALSPCHAYRW